MNAGTQRIHRLLATSVVLLLGCAAHATEVAGNDQATAQWQSSESIRAAAGAHVKASLGIRGGRTQVEAAELDSRLRLPACTKPLQAEMPYGNARGNRVTVRVSCPAESGWRIHVPVDIVTVGDVVATTRALARGVVLTQADLTLTHSELGRLGHGYFLDPANVIGQRLRRPLPAGSVLSPAQLEAPPAITRGQIVTIVAKSRVIGVRMNGKALEDGVIGQVIDIENISSGKRVQGIVRSARSVEILLQ